MMTTDNQSGDGSTRIIKKRGNLFGGPSVGELFTQGQMDEFAMENLAQERYRIHGILVRVLPEHKEIFDKCILGNKK